MQGADQRTAVEERCHPRIDLFHRRTRELVLVRADAAREREQLGHQVSAARHDEAIRRALARLRVAAPHRHHPLQAAMIEDRHAVGEARQLIQVVRRDEDDAVRPTQLLHDVPEALRPYGIQPVRRLVEHHHLLVVQQRLGEAQALEVALRQLAHALGPVLLETELRDRARDARVQLVRRHSGEQRVAVQGVVNAPRRRDVHQLGQVAYSVVLNEPARREPMDAHVAGGGAQEAEQERDERALAGAVGPGEPEYLTGPDLERQVVERDDLAAGPAPVALADAIEVDQRGAIGWVALGAVPYGVIPGGIVAAGTVPGAGAHAVQGPLPARWIQRTPSSRRPRRTSEHPR